MNRRKFLATIGALFVVPKTKFPIPAGTVITLEVQKYVQSWDFGKEEPFTSWAVYTPEGVCTMEPINIEGIYDFEKNS